MRVRATVGSVERFVQLPIRKEDIYASVKGKDRFQTDGDEPFEAILCRVT